MEEDVRSLGRDKVDAERYAMFQRCMEANDASEWNEWRREHPDATVWMQGAKFESARTERPRLKAMDLSGVEFARGDLRRMVMVGADLRDIQLTGADLRGAILVNADLRGATLQSADLKGVNLKGADLRGAQFRYAKFDGDTLLETEYVDRETDFTGSALTDARVDPGLRQLLEYNVRRRRWENWYEHHPLLAWPVWLFWLMCDYGRSTWRILATFALLAVAFAGIYLAFPDSVMTTWDNPKELFDFGYALYFSVVTMTTLGFGDVYAAPDSSLGQILLVLQVILGYLLLGALVTRLAVLFTGGGPSGDFYEGEK